MRRAQRLAFVWGFRAGAAWGSAWTCMQPGKLEATPRRAALASGSPPFVVRAPIREIVAIWRTLSGARRG